MELPSDVPFGELMDRVDWSATSLGHAASWSPVLSALAKMVLNSPTPMLLAWGDDFSLIYNDSCAAILGGGHPHALGRPISAAWPDTWSEVQPFFTQAQRGEPVHLSDATLDTRRNGEPQEGRFDIALTPVSEADQVGGILCVVTVAKNIVLRLQQSERHLREMSDSMPQMVFSCFPDGTSDYFNTRWVEFGGPAFPSTTQGWRELIHPDDKDRVQAAWEVSIDKGSAFDLEYRLRHHSGQYRWVLARAVPQFTNEKVVARWWGTCTDVDEQRRLLDEHRLARQRIEATLLAVDVGTWITDLKLKKVMSDPNMAYLHGVPAEHWDGEDIDKFFSTIHPDDVEHVRSCYESSAATGVPFHAFYRVKKDDHGWRHLHARGKVELAAEGHPAWLCGLVIDVTQQMQAEEALRQMDRRKDEFLAMLSHELRNPLASISNAADLLSRISSSPRKVEDVGLVLQRQIHHIAELVDDLLDVARVTRGVVSLDSFPVDLVGVARDAAEQFTSLAEANEVALNIRLPPEPVVVQGDRKRLVQVLSNLLQNAVKFTAKGGNVILDLSIDSRRARLHVRDNGMGMSPSLLSSAFQLFVQGQRPAHRQQGGLGMGLALAKKLTELHGGSLTAYSAGEGLGSLFELFLPLVDEQAFSEPACPTLRGPTDFSAEPVTAPLRVLVVDDNVDAANMLAMLLNETGYEALQAHTAAEAEQVAREALPDACLLDIGLPDATGYELAVRIRSIAALKKVCLAAVTGYGQESDRRAAFAAGFDQHFPKPVESSILTQWLASVPRRIRTKAIA